MEKKRHTDMHCSIAKALEAFGDGWSLLIIRDSFFGIRRFSDYQHNLGIAKNILAQRLAQLTAHGILLRSESGPSGQRHEYTLSPKGEALLPVLTALREWSDAWVFGPGHEPLIVTERHSGQRVPALQLQNAKGQPLRHSDLKSRPGPGADERVYKFLELARGARARRASDKAVG